MLPIHLWCYKLFCFFCKEERDMKLEKVVDGTR
jgi:hypothetical protein